MTAAPRPQSQHMAKFKVRSSWLAALGCAALVVVTLVALFRDRGPRSVRYEYVADLSRLIGLLQQGEIVLGHLDEDGNFTRDPDLEPLPPSGKAGAPEFTLINKPARRDEEVFEYRCDRLIKGTLDDEGNFIPKLDSVILTFKEYRHDPRGPRIYNLPGRFVEVPAPGS